MKLVILICLCAILGVSLVRAQDPLSVQSMYFYKEWYNKERGNAIVLICVYLKDSQKIKTTIRFPSANTVDLTIENTKFP